MWPVIGGLISGLGSFFGAEQTNQQSAANIAQQNAANLQQQQQAEAFNAAQTQQQEQFQSGMVSQQEAFQQSMSNTAYQRASADMKAAGLNPMMMFGSGGPASTPSGASASGAAASISPAHMAAAPYSSPLSTIGDTAQKIVNNAVQLASIDKMTQEVANMQTVQAKVAAETDLTHAQTATEGQRPSSVIAGTEQAQANTQRALAQANIDKATLPVVQNSALTASNQMDMPASVRYYLDQLSYGGRAASDTLKPVGQVLHGVNSARTFNDRWYNP